MATRPKRAAAADVRIAGTGRALPAKAVTTAAIEAELGLQDGHLSGQTGVTCRYVCEGESQIDLALSACHAALEDAGCDAQEIDLVLSGSAVPYQTLPATAPLVMRELGIDDAAAAAFDVNSTCLGFLSAVDLAADWISSGRASTALVFASELASRALPWDSAPEVAALFGDGAAAAVIKAGDGPGLSARLFRTYPSAYEACRIGAGGTRFDFEKDAERFAAHSRFEMEGDVLFRISARHFGGFVADVLAAAGWQMQDVDLIVPHQASPHALRHMIRQVSVVPEKVIDISADVGNQIAASIPFALDVARREGRMPQGTKVLMLGTSAGVSFGGVALKV